MLQFEAALAKAQASLNMIPQLSAEKVIDVLSKIKIARAELADGTLRDGVPVITFLSLIKEHLSEPAMHHKNNPVLSEALVAIAKMNAQLQSQQLLSMIHVNERDATAWILEWNVIPQMLINAGTALNHAITIATKMKVNKENMKKNVEHFFKK